MFEQNGVGDGDLADVVQWRGKADEAKPFLR